MGLFVTTPDVLIVDDDAMVRRGIRRLLVSRGFTVAEAGDGLEALLLLGSGLRPRLVLLDMQMPMMGGLEVLEKIRASRDFANARVLLVTGGGVGSPHANGMIEKPFKSSELLERVGAELRGSS
jgi:CheY-like chemotaxis protein